jgi:hypothetical protein
MCVFMCVLLSYSLESNITAALIERDWGKATGSHLKNHKDVTSDVTGDEKS